MDLILMLAEYRYPPVNHDEVYLEIFEQAENFKKHPCLDVRGVCYREGYLRLCIGVSFANIVHIENNPVVTQRV
jgi:hypothetical protein